MSSCTRAAIPAIACQTPPIIIIIAAANQRGDVVVTVNAFETQLLA
jgi:hypothetical protein